ncbi:hypothetical protein DH2020_048233 [Rehmannia glutinosa]|uniref:Uncharacterized protein n=1 Tax=Rehmannia glutinosa TaxID=99300 RepID=A0ABR0U6B7_REHGL
MEYLNDETKKMANVIIQNIMNNKTCISTAEKVDALFELIKGLIRDLDEDLRDEVLDEDFKEEQNSVARLIQMLQSDDPEEMLKVIIIFILLTIDRSSNLIIFVTLTRQH